MVSGFMGIGPEILNELEQYCERITAEIEKNRGGRAETHSYRVDQVALNLIESFIESHFRVCSIHETFMENIRKSKSFMIDQNGKIILAGKLGKKLDEQAKQAMIEIVDISQELREETGVPAEISTMRLFLSFMIILTGMYRKYKSQIT